MKFTITMNFFFFFLGGTISAMMRISFKIKLKNSKIGKTYNEWYPSKEEIEY